jgi:hypothetical protein
MASLGPYVRVMVDESFKQVEVRLDRHEELILELQRSYVIKQIGQNFESYVRFSQMNLNRKSVHLQLESLP